jgi:hypothetical protein
VYEHLEKQSGFHVTSLHLFLGRRRTGDRCDQHQTSGTLASDGVREVRAYTVSHPTWSLSLKPSPTLLDAMSPYLDCMRQADMPPP